MILVIYIYMLWCNRNPVYGCIREFKCSQLLLAKQSKVPACLVRLKSRRRIRQFQGKKVIFALFWWGGGEKMAFSRKVPGGHEDLKWHVLPDPSRYWGFMMSNISYFSKIYVENENEIYVENERTCSKGASLLTWFYLVRYRN